MDVKLHANATTTPKTRAYIQASHRSARELAAELGVSEVTVRRWRARDGVQDHSHAPKHPPISLSGLEEQLVLELRTQVGLPFEDIVEVMHRCVRANLSRSAIYRCLRRHGVAARAKTPAAEAPGIFAPTPFGFVHIDLKHLPRLQGIPAYVFVAIERTTRFAHVEIVTQRDAGTIAACLEGFLTAFAQGATALRQASVRSRLRAPRYHPSAHPALSSADQRHGRALQPPHRPGHRQHPTVGRKRRQKPLRKPLRTRRLHHRLRRRL
jgi:transposase